MSNRSYAGVGKQYAMADGDGLCVSSSFRFLKSRIFGNGRAVFLTLLTRGWKLSAIRLRAPFSSHGRWCRPRATTRCHFNDSSDVVLAGDVAEPIFGVEAAKRALSKLTRENEASRVTVETATDPAEIGCQCPCTTGPIFLTSAQRLPDSALIAMLNARATYGVPTSEFF